MKEETDYTKGYRQALLDIQADINRIVDECTDTKGKISAKYLKKQINIEVLPQLDELK